MGKKLKSRKWLTITMGGVVEAALLAHQQKLSDERGGEPVTRSDAVRDAILRTKGAVS